MIISQTIDSTANINRQQSSTPMYTTMLCQNYHFRILTGQYRRNAFLIFYTAFTWVVCGFALSILICSQYLYSQYYPFFVTASLGLIPLNGFVVYNKKIFGNGFTLSSILFNLTTIAISILLWFQLQYVGFAFGAYLIFESVCNCFMIENKGKIMLKILVLIQMEIVCWKMDDNVNMEWDQALLGFVILGLFLALSGLSIMVYSLLICLKSFRETHYQIKSKGLKYLSLNMLTSASLISILIWGVFINSNHEIPTIIAWALSFFTSIFTFFKRTQIALFLCKTIEPIVVKESNTFKIESKEFANDKSLFQVSQNWFTQNYDKQTCEKDIKIQGCVACMDAPSESVWLPCGHCTLCSNCTNQLIKNQIISCPLCKSKPSQIIRISKKNTKEPDLSCKVLRRNQYQISDCLVIKYI